MRSDRCLLPTASIYEHLRLARSQHLSGACAPPRPPRLATSSDGDWGTWRFTAARSASAGEPGSPAALSAACPRATMPLTPLSPPRDGPRSSRGPARHDGRDRFRGRSVKIRPLVRSRMPSTGSFPRLARAAWVGWRSREWFRRPSQRSAGLRARGSHAFAWDPHELGARPRTVPDRVKWKRPASLRRLLSAGFCNVNDARAPTRASDPRPHRA